MRTSAVAVLSLTAVLSTIAAARFGGYAVVSVDAVPDYLVVGKPTELVFTVKQHGITPLPDLSPTLVATSGGNKATARATRLPNARYRVEFTVPEPGDWRVVINADFGRSRGMLLPLRAYASAPKTVAATDVDRGRILFVAKGCVTCHVRGELEVKGELPDYGPNLTDKRFAVSYLRDFLADPSIKPAGPEGKRMPRPELRGEDVPLIIAYLNSERRTASR